MRDAVDLRFAEGSPAFELHDDAGRGLFLVLREEGLLRDREVDAALLDLVEAVDRPGELPLEGALVVELLDELGHAQVLRVEDLEPDAAALGETRGGQFQPQLRHLFGRHRDHVPCGRKLVGDLLLLEPRRDLTGILGGEVRVENLVIGLVDEDDCKGDAQKRDARRREDGEFTGRRKGLKPLPHLREKLTHGFSIPLSFRRISVSVIGAS